MRIVLVSSVLKGLDSEAMTSSSEKFEYDFANAMSRLCAVEIYSSALDSQHSVAQGVLRIRGFGSPNPVKRLMSLSSLFQTESHSPIVIFFGYDLVEVATQLAIKCLHRCVVVSFLFDTHVVAIGGYSRIKAQGARAYFALSIRLLNHLDGFLVFQASAVRELGLVRPHLVTRPGCDVTQSGREVRGEQDPYIITYVGSLTAHNGIRELLGAFALSRDPQLRLRVFGLGEMQSDVEAFSRSDERVYYGGRITQEQVRSEYRNANLLVNLRDPGHYVSRFAFPSKLVEYMATGVPVLSTDIARDEEFQRCVYLVKCLSAEGILETVQVARAASVLENESVGDRARLYLMKHHAWAPICTEVLAFLGDLVSRADEAKHGSL